MIVKCAYCGPLPLADLEESGTVVMPKVTLPEGYEPLSAAVIMPQPTTHPDGRIAESEGGLADA